MKTILILAMLAATGCAAPRGDRPPMTYTPDELSYMNGKGDGCPSGERAAGHPYRTFTKNVPLYLGDAGYKSGWDDGFAVCKGQYEAIGRALQR